MLADASSRSHEGSVILRSRLTQAVVIEQLAERREAPNARMTERLKPEGHTADHRTGHSRGQESPHNRITLDTIGYMAPRVADIARDSERDFLRTHGWITFRLDLSGLTPWFYEYLGEARSKCRHLALTPLAPAIADQLHSLYLAKGAHATTAIEGNTLTEEQAQRVVEGDLELPPSQDYLRREIENIVEACDTIEAIVRQHGEFEITTELLRGLNRQVLADLKREDWVQPGEFRKRDVGVGTYKCPDHSDIGFLTAMLTTWLNGDDFKPGTDQRKNFLTAVLRAAIAHVYIAWIHPFGDGNGRTARLVEFGVLTAAGVPSVAAHLLSNHYNETRSEYYRHLNYASRSGGDLHPFLMYAAQGFVDQLNQQLVMVHGQNLGSVWTNFVHQRFHDQHGPTAKRQRDLVLALQSGEAVPVGRLRHLTPQLAEAYAGKQNKTITRDVNVLLKLDLVERTAKGIRARTELMYRFLPDVAGGVACVFDRTMAEAEALEREAAANGSHSTSL